MTGGYPETFSETEFQDRLAVIRNGAPAELLATLRDMHGAYDGCAAHSEGQTCCVDLLVGSSEAESDVVR